MKDNSIYLYRALRAEIIKIKNTLGLWSALIFPLFIVFMNFMIFLSRPQMLATAKGNLWIHYTNNSMMMWSILFMPLFIGIITFYINFNEHKNNVWRHVYSLPIPKISVYTAKYLISILIVAATMVFFYFINYLSMKMLAAFRPEIPFGRYVITSILPLSFLKVMLASIGIISIQFVVSIIFQNFVLPLGFSVLATLTSAFLLRWENIVYYPYAYPFFAAQDLVKNDGWVFINPVLFSIACSAAVATIGYVIHSRMRVK